MTSKILAAVTKRLETSGINKASALYSIAAAIYEGTSAKMDFSAASDGLAKSLLKSFTKDALKRVEVDLKSKRKYNYEISEAAIMGGQVLARAMTKYKLNPMTYAVLSEIAYIAYEELKRYDRGF